MFRRTIASLVVLSLACGAVPEGQAGPVNGPLSGTYRVSANSTDYFDVALHGGELTTIVVDGDGDTDLDLYVYDARGNLVAQDIDNTDYCVVSFFVPRTGAYRIKVMNRGNVYNEYHISVR